MNAKTPERYYPRQRPGLDRELQRDLRYAFELIYRYADDLAARGLRVPGGLTLDQIREALQAKGTRPLNVEGLLGQLAQPQKSGFPVVTALPAPDDPLSQDGQGVIFGNALYFWSEATGSWQGGSGVASVAGGATGYAFTAGPTATMSVANAATVRSSIGLKEMATVKCNFSAVAAPTANDDTGDGYEVGSLWVNVTLDNAYICCDATLAAAVWKLIT